MAARYSAVELAHAARNQRMAFQDLRCSARIDICRPVAEFMAAAEDHAIAARKHVEIEYRIEIGVGDGRLRLDERLAESLELGFVGERSLLDRTAMRAEIREQRRHQTIGLRHQGCEPAGIG